MLGFDTACLSHTSLAQTWRTQPAFARIQASALRLKTRTSHKKPTPERKKGGACVTRLKPGAGVTGVFHIPVNTFLDRIHKINRMFVGFLSCTSCSSCLKTCSVLFCEYEGCHVTPENFWTPTYQNTTQRRHHPLNSVKNFSITSIFTGLVSTTDAPSVLPCLIRVSSE